MGCHNFHSQYRDTEISRQQSEPNLKEQGRKAVGKCGYRAGLPAERESGYRAMEHLQLLLGRAWKQARTGKKFRLA